MRIEAIPTDSDQLGESPVWDHRIGALYWADQLGRRVRRYDARTGVVKEWQLGADLGCVALTSDVNTLLVAQPDRYVLLDLIEGGVRTLVVISQPRVGVRLNDGRCDRQGRLVGGSVTTDGGDAGGSIWQVEGSGKVEILRKGMVIVNSICCNLAGDTIYYADSRGGLLYRRAYGLFGNDIGAEEVVVDLRPFGGTPDGATIDEEGAIWLALIMPGKIVRILPDGKLDREIRLPAPYISSLTFGGERFDTLYVTTVRETGMLISSKHPDAGKLFSITGLGVRGVPEGLLLLDNHQPRRELPHPL